MKKLLVAGLCALALSACAGDRSDAIRAAFSAQVEAWNATGVDPLQLRPDQQTYALLACGTLSSLATVINPDAPGLTEQAGAWCGTAVKVLSPAS